MKKSFILHIDSLSVLSELTNEQKGELFQAVFDYNIGKEVVLTGLMKAIFVSFKNQFDRDNDKYQSIVERNKINGSKGGTPKKPKGTQKNPVGSSGGEQNPNKADNDSDSVNDSDNENKNEKELIIDNDKPLSVYQLCVHYWLNEFHIGWSFGGVQGKCMKSIIKKIETRQRNSGKLITTESTLAIFKLMCENLPEFYKDKDLQVIDSKLNEVLESLKNKLYGHTEGQSKYR